MEDWSNPFRLKALEKANAALTERVAELEKNSHPPIDLAPSIIEILEYLGIRRN